MSVNTVKDLSKPAYTVVSILPMKVEELKPGCVPNVYLIPPSKDGKPQVLHIIDVRTFMYVDMYKGSIVIPIDPREMAESVVEDFIRASMAYDPGNPDIRPGLFHVPGFWTPVDIETRFATELHAARTAQNRWYATLVRLADDDWQRNRLHRSITDLQRVAANYLGLDREWLVDLEMVRSKRCHVCTTILPKSAAVCHNCRAVLDAEKLKDVKFVGVA